MIDHRPFRHLGAFANEWLEARYHFSFADYHHDARMGCGALRVWNDDTIQPGCGFDPHSHRNMEIITYVRQGAVTHHDSLGNVGRTEAGQVQVMSAGTGITHAEYNREPHVTTLFQIWIHPRQRGLAPRWETRPFPRLGSVMQILASGLTSDGDVPMIHADARVWGARLDAGDSLTHRLQGHSAYLVAAKGRLKIADLVMEERDGAVIHHEPTLPIIAVTPAELVMVELF